MTKPIQDMDFNEYMDFVHKQIMLCDMEGEDGKPVEPFRDLLSLTCAIVEDEQNKQRGVTNIVNLFFSDIGLGKIYSDLDLGHELTDVMNKFSSIVYMLTTMSRPQPPTHLTHEGRRLIGTVCLRAGLTPDTDMMCACAFTDAHGKRVGVKESVLHELMALAVSSTFQAIERHIDFAFLTTKALQSSAIAKELVRLKSDLKN